MEAVPHTDLRQSQRIPATISIRLLLQSEGCNVEHEAFTIDLSPQGAKVRTPRELVPGETVGIIAGGDSEHAIAARVVWAKRVTSDSWSLAGLEFVEVLPV